MCRKSCPREEAQKRWTSEFLFLMAPEPFSIAFRTSILLTSSKQKTSYHLSMHLTMPPKVWPGAVQEGAAHWAAPAATRRYYTVGRGTAGASHQHCNCWRDRNHARRSQLWHRCSLTAELRALWKTLFESALYAPNEQIPMEQAGEPLEHKTKQQDAFVQARAPQEPPTVPIVIVWLVCKACNFSLAATTCRFWSSQVVFYTKLLCTNCR